MTEALILRRAVVKSSRIVLTLEVAPGAPAMTTPGMARVFVGHVPTLPLHRCKNSRGPLFGDVLEETSLPHVLEHLVIDALVRRSGSDETFVGTTEWEEPGRIARVELSYVDDVEALGAVKWALEEINGVVAEVTDPGQEE